MMAWCFQAWRSFRKSFYLSWICLCQCLGTQLLFAICVVLVLATMAMGMLAARQSFSHSIVSLLSVQPLMGHKTFIAGIFLISCCSASLKFLISPRAHGIVQNRTRVLPGIFVLVSVCAVTYGSCEGDINWEARLSFHGSACLLLGKEMELVA